MPHLPFQYGRRSTRNSPIDEIVIVLVGVLGFCLWYVAGR